jgi:hypothetical protein
VSNQPSRRPEEPPEEFLGDPDPDRDALPPPHLADTKYLVVQARIVYSVVATIVLFPPLTLVALLLGLPTSSAAVLAAASAPLLVVAHAIAKHYFRR